MCHENFAGKCEIVLTTDKYLLTPVLGIAFRSNLICFINRSKNGECFFGLQ